MKKPRNIVGPVVRQFREKKGLTQADLAAKLNLAGWDISRETLAKIESRIRWVSDFEVLLLADSLEISGPELLRLAASHSKDNDQTAS